MSPASYNSLIHAFNFIDKFMIHDDCLISLALSRLPSSKFQSRTRTLFNLFHCSIMFRSIFHKTAWQPDCDCESIRSNHLIHYIRCLPALPLDDSGLRTLHDSSSHSSLRTSNFDYLLTTNYLASTLLFSALIRHWALIICFGGKFGSPWPRARPAAGRGPDSTRTPPVHPHPPHLTPAAPASTPRLGPAPPRRPAGRAPARPVPPTPQTSQTSPSPNSDSGRRPGGPLRVPPDSRLQNLDSGLRFAWFALPFSVVSVFWN